MHTLLFSLALVTIQGTPAYVTPLPTIDPAPMAAAQIDLERARALMDASTGVIARVQAEDARVRSVDLAAAEAQLASLDAARTLSFPARIVELSEARAQLAALDSRGAARTAAPLPTPEMTAPIAGDPGDSLYRAGTGALNRGDYARAAQLFRQVREKYPTSVRAGDSYYWEAFALYRQSGTENLKGARSLLAQQQVKFPSSATRGDASSLYGRVQGELARRGDPDAQIWVNTQTSTLAPAAVVAPTPASGVAVARPARAPRMVVSSMERPERPENPERPERPEVGGGDEDNDLPPGCDRTTYETKIEALNALISMQSDRAMPIIKRVLAKRDDCSAGLRKKAVFLLSQHQDDSTGAALLDVVRNDPDAGVKAQAVFWLSQVDSPQAVTALEEILKNSTDVDLQRKALFALSQQKDPRSAQILRSYAERTDVPEELEEQAIFWLSQTNDGNNGEFLRGLYGRLTRESAKEKVLFALSQQDDPANGAWLVARAKDPNESMELRKRALFWAGQRKGALPDLIGLYASMPDREMREQLVFVYSQSSDKAASDKLFDIAKNDPDPELRKKALFWLGQSNDPRVVQLLQDIIDK
ncbi:MAG TPA: HEAT repeat domain-containing protein [Gemmatimonadales bacterium]|nr:HEAT repeat domain-containing protein [Gemmatimonadales bacterium]